MGCEASHLTAPFGAVIFLTYPNTVKQVVRTSIVLHGIVFSARIVFFVKSKISCKNIAFFLSQYIVEYTKTIKIDKIWQNC